MFGRPTIRDHSQNMYKGGSDAKTGPLKIFGALTKIMLILPLKIESMISVGLTPIFLGEKGGG